MGQKKYEGIDMKNTEEIRELLEKVYNAASYYVSLEDGSEHYDLTPREYDDIKKALALLPPKCETCGGSGEVPGKGKFSCNIDGVPNRGFTIPCPVCQPEEKPRINMAMPEEWIGQYHNACTDPCDMLCGPCACGATHHLNEWIITRKKLTKEGWVNPKSEKSKVPPKCEKTFASAREVFRKYLPKYMKCKTCEGAGRLYDGDLPDYQGSIPCPDCQPEPNKFTEECREFIRQRHQLRDKVRIDDLLLKACDRLEAAEENVTSLKAEIGMLKMGFKVKNENGSE
jgi:hypothetical protein